MPGLNVTQEDIDQFVAITQSSQEDAQRFLSSGTTLEGALEDYFAAQAAAGAPSGDIEEEIITDDEVMSEQDQPAEKKPRVGGPTTLDGRPVDDTLPEGWGQPQNPGRRAPGGFGGVADLFSSGLHGSASRGQPQQNSDDDDEDEDDEKGQEFFTGGEKSGLAVQNPDRPGQRGARGIVDKILEQAKSNGPSKSPEPSGSGHHFGGSGNVLGSEDTPSDAAPPAAAPASAPSPAAAPSGAMEALMGMLRGSAQPPQDDDNEVQTRRLTFWRNGFSIEDGPLLSYDEPRNRETLEAIQSGRAPPSLFGVRFNQPLQVEVAQRKSEDYQPPPKRPAKPFEGSGNRLGAATPQVVSGSTTPSMPGSLPAEAAAAPPAPPSFAVDQSQPTTSIQVRLGDGTRLVAKVNLTHTVEDLRNFVAAARPDQRPFVLQTTFPSKELSDHKETIEGAKLQNAVVVQRFI